MPFSNAFSSGQHCAAYGCTNNQKKRNAARKQLCGTHGVAQEECGCNIYLLHRFPADPELRRRWVIAINRKGFAPTASSRVCSQHFVDGKRSEQNPVPMLRLGYDTKVVIARRRLVKHELQVAAEKETALKVKNSLCPDAKCQTARMPNAVRTSAVHSWTVARVEGATAHWDGGTECRSQETQATVSTAQRGMQCTVLVSSTGTQTG